ncbi:tetratricopeptide repeat protein [bacterium]|nr:tetratricopeptide repeat protein [bacterium]
MKRLGLFLFIICTLSASAVKAQDYTAVSDTVNLYYAENDIDNAFNTALTIPEDDRTAQNWLLIGNILHDKGKNDEAIFMYNKAVLKDENYYKGYYNLGVLYLEENRPNLAIEQFEKVKKLKKDYPYAFYNTGCAYLQLKEYKKARREFLNAIALKNTIPEFHYNLAYTYKQLKNEKNAGLYLKYYNELELNRIK